jgi:hypothetical protein
MSDTIPGLTCTDLIASAAQALLDGGYRRINGKFAYWDTPTSRLFEDEYSVVGMVAFDSCSELLQSWPDLQGRLVDLISGHIGRQESKAWDGYLVLLSPGLAPVDIQEVENIRSNTTRLRKLVATGDDLRTVADVERVLRPLLPFSHEQASVTQGSVLELLPKLLTDCGIEKETTKLLVDAFRDQSPLLEKLHQLKGES